MLRSRDIDMKIEVPPPLMTTLTKIDWQTVFTIICISLLQLGTGDSLRVGTNRQVSQRKVILFVRVRAVDVMSLVTSHQKS